MTTELVIILIYAKFLLGVKFILRNLGAIEGRRPAKGDLEELQFRKYPAREVKSSK